MSNFRKRRKKRVSPISAGSNVSVWLCAHPESVSNKRPHLITESVPLPKEKSPPSSTPQWLCSHTEEREVLEIPSKLAEHPCQVEKMDQDEPPLSPSLYNPKRKYKHSLRSLKSPHAKEEEEKEEDSSFELPLTPVFTEDLMFSNYDWGLGDSPSSGECVPPATIQFSDEI